MCGPLASHGVPLIDCRARLYMHTPGMGHRSMEQLDTQTLSPLVVQVFVKLLQLAQEAELGLQGPLPILLPTRHFLILFFTFYFMLPLFHLLEESRNKVQCSTVQ